MVGQVNIADSTSNNWLLTGVQVEVGEQATPFEHRSRSDELRRCKRYYEILDTLIYGTQYGSNGASSLGMFYWTEQREQLHYVGRHQ